MSDAMVMLSRDLGLPIDLVTEAIAVLGRRGKGKDEHRRRDCRRSR